MLLKIGDLVPRERDLIRKMIGKESMVEIVLPSLPIVSETVN